MSRLCINIKDDEKAAIVLKLLRELPFVEIEGDTGEKDKRIEKKQKGSLEDLFGLWEHRDISLKRIREKAWKRSHDSV